MTELTSCCKNFQLSDGVTNFAVSYKRDAQKIKYCSVEMTGHLFFTPICLLYSQQSTIFAKSFEHLTRKLRAESRTRQIFCKTMTKKDYTIRLVVRPSRLDPSRAKLQVQVRLSDGRRFFYTAPGSVDTQTAKNEFDSTGRPYNMENYNKKCANSMWVLYNSARFAMSKIYDTIPTDQITREMIATEIEKELSYWPKAAKGYKG